MNPQRTRFYTRILVNFMLGVLAIGLLSACTNRPTTDEDPIVSDSLVYSLGDTVTSQKVRTGAEILLEKYLDKIRNIPIAVVANHTSLIDSTHLVDTLLGLGVDIKKVFAPEHGFRGAADAGAKISNTTDARTGLPILSLYGNNRKPTSGQLADVELVLFDIQDVGSRHYTYISTMTYVMETCAALGKQFWVLDRPNPNGWYVDGPVMQKPYQSFIGMHQIPIVHGMTTGEYAQMINGEGWLGDSVRADLTVITCEDYHHNMSWQQTGLDWVAPSPNIPTPYAAYLYPALCWFEPTPISIGRGTHEAFTILGAPWVNHVAQARFNIDSLSFYGLTYRPYTFTPVSIPGKSTYPKFQDQLCQGYQFINQVDGKNLFLAGIYLLQHLYQHTQSHDASLRFFKKGFEKWPGNKELQDQVKNQISPEEIWQSWQQQVNDFKIIRKNYLLYPDFD